jgi:hypothetical protein
MFSFSQRRTSVPALRRHLPQRAGFCGHSRRVVRAVRAAARRGLKALAVRGAYGAPIAILTLAAAIVGTTSGCGTALPDDLGNFRPTGNWSAASGATAAPGPGPGAAVGEIDGRPIFLDPLGRPFYAVSMVYAFDPEAGPYADDLTWESVRWSLEAMKAHGFNTLNLYGDKFLPEIFDWCDQNGMAVIPRTSYTDGIELSPERREYPDFMDPDFRALAVKRFEPLLELAKSHPSFLALDMDQRWLFPLDWSGATHAGPPRLGPAAIAHLPRWLESRFGSIERLNAAWGRSYRSFDAVLTDPAIIKDGQVRPLGRAPWRLDIVEYTLWTVNDFLKSLAAELKKRMPALLLTYTTEHPEVCPFPWTTRDAGIDFISPVHYNKKEFYDRDWIGAGKIIFETLFHHDLQGLPVYIAETGWRTDPLDQWPRVTNYAFARPGDEHHLAGLYLRQVALLHSLPWIVGWAHFKMHDKPPEGDFGYLRDDRTEKPIATVGRAINSILPVAATAFPAAHIKLFYPSYALAAEPAGFRQLTSVAHAIEHDALLELERLAADADPLLSDARALARHPVTLESARRIRDRWTPLSFSSRVDTSPTGVNLLAADPLELLSARDRDELTKSRTVTFCRAGLYDERYRATTPWFLESAGLSRFTGESRVHPLALDRALNHNGVGDRADFDGRGGALAAKALDAIRAHTSGLFSNLKADTRPDGNDNVACLGQDVALDAPAGLAELRVVAGVTGGDFAFPVRLLFTDGTEQLVYPDVALRDWTYRENRATEIAVDGNRGEPRALTILSVAVPPLKKLRAIRLPNEPGAHLFALTGFAKPEGRNVPIEVTMGDATIKGRTAWAYFLPKDALPADRVLARFSDGRPAVVTSADHRHIVFLFDILTWEGRPGAISENLAGVAKFVRGAIKALEAAS